MIYMKRPANQDLCFNVLLGQTRWKYRVDPLWSFQTPIAILVMHITHCVMPRNMMQCVIIVNIFFLFFLEKIVFWSKSELFIPDIKGFTSFIKKYSIFKKRILFFLRYMYVGDN